MERKHAILVPYEISLTEDDKDCTSNTTYVIIILNLSVYHLFN